MNYPELERVIDIIAKLRDPKTGCPWDLKQDHKSLLKYLIEESYEYIQATEEESFPKMEEELGDVFLQILLHSQIASEDDHFSIESVAKVLADKMVRRHPHVFTKNTIADTAQEVLVNWERIKQEERKGQEEKRYHITIDDAYAPALSAANKIGAKSNAVNFDWDCIEDVWKKVEEEIEEVKVEVLAGNKEKTKDEIGDLLFSIAQYARHLDIDPEEALKEANLKFVGRINKVEDAVRSTNRQMIDLSTNELEQVWATIKKAAKS